MTQLYRLPVPWENVSKYYAHDLTSVLKKNGINIKMVEPKNGRDISGLPRFSRGKSIPRTVKQFNLLIIQQKMICLVAKFLREEGFVWAEISSFVGGYAYQTIHKWAFDLLGIDLQK